MIDQKLRPYLTFDYDNYYRWNDEQTLMCMIRTGEKIMLRMHMTQEYFDELIWLLVAQMDSEYVGAYGYMPITFIAPKFSARELKDVPAIVHDEFTHGNRIREILNNIGFDADKWVEDYQEVYSFRLKHGEKLPRGRRYTEDFRVNIFYYDLISDNDLETWINFGVFQFVQDRGAGEQIRDTLDSSFGPWAEANRRTMSEENKHIHHGDTWMASLFIMYPVLVQKQFDLWWPRTLATFGRPESKRNDLWRKLGLKRRTNEEVLRAFLDRTEHPVGLQEAGRKIGLKIPATEVAVEIWRRGDHFKLL